MQDNTESSPEIILARTRLRRNQATLNVELGLSTKTSITSAQGGASTSSSVSGGALGSGGVIGGSGGGGDSGGGGGFEDMCFVANTVINMFDHAPRFINTIQPEFEVESPDENGELQRGRVVGISQKLYSDVFVLTFEGGRYTETRPNHRYRNEGGIWVTADQLEYSLFRSGDKWVRSNITEKKLIKLEQPKSFYNFEVETYHSYVANNDWVSNRKIEQQQ